VLLDFISAYSSHSFVLTNMVATAASIALDPTLDSTLEQDLYENMLACMGIDPMHDTQHQPLTETLTSPRLFSILKGAEHFKYAEVKTVEYHLVQGGCDPFLIQNVIHALWFRDTLTKAITTPPSQPQTSAQQKQRSSIDLADLPAAIFAASSSGQVTPSGYKHMATSVQDMPRSLAPPPALQGSPLSTSTKSPKNKKKYLKELTQRMVAFVTRAGNDNNNSGNS